MNPSIIVSATQPEVDQANKRGKTNQCEARQNESEH
jgi:hypothetical protein